MRRLINWWRAFKYAWSADRQREIDEAMYYEQADRDGCEYPPQYRGR